MVSCCFGISAQELRAGELRLQIELDQVCYQGGDQFESHELAVRLSVHIVAVSRLDRAV